MTTTAHPSATEQHDLLNPLSAMRMAAIRFRRAVPNEASAALDVLERNGQRMEALIEGVLSMGRLHAEEIEAHVVDVELGELLDRAVADARMAAEAKGLMLAAEYDPKLLVRADRTLAASAVQNLLDNAVKYTDAGEIHVSAEASDDRVALHVRDNCSGLSEEELRIAFQPLERGRTRGKPGSGLGLAIARHAIEAQGGTIGAESPAERGCHFWITLPRSVH